MAKQKRKPNRKSRPFGFKNKDFPRQVAKRRLRKLAGEQNLDDILELPKTLKMIARKVVDDAMAEDFKRFVKKKNGGKRPIHEPKPTR